MSSPSIKYDPTASIPPEYPDGNDPATTVSALASHMVPDSLRRHAAIKNHRDAVIAKGLIDLSDNGIENVINTLSAKLRSMADNSSEEVRVYCELLAAFSYASGNTDLTKAALLRLDPSKANGLSKTIYSALMERGIKSEAFKTMLEVNAQSAIDEWSRQV